MKNELSPVTPALPSSVPPDRPREEKQLRAPLLFLSVLVIATCGLIYELVAGTLASYLLGDSVTQFSTIIGVYLSAMGIGSYLSKFIARGLANRFVDIELTVALVGGYSAPLLFLTFGSTDYFRLILYLIVLIVGILVGLEIPLLLRILRHEFAFKDLVAHVLTFDYIGGLVASLMFPLLLMPRLGLVRTSLLFGLLNAAVGLWSSYLLQSQVGNARPLRIKCVAVIALLVAGLIYADQFTRWMEDDLYAGQIIYAKTSPYQRIVVTRSKDNFQLYLNGNLQFNSSDEYRYHEALVHPAMASFPGAKRVLVTGGGDGLALREILRYDSVEEVLLIDLDSAITNLASNSPIFSGLNRDSFKDPRVRLLNADAMVWLGNKETAEEKFDVAIVDFPDPNNYVLGKLYTTHFYRLLMRHLTPDSVVAIQSTSPLFARNSYWCIANTMKAAGFHTLPYQLSVPTFGVWGFVLASKNALEIPSHVREDLRFLNDPAMKAMFAFSKDIAEVPTKVNRLNNQVLVSIYDQDWKRWF